MRQMHSPIGGLARRLHGGHDGGDDADKHTEHRTHNKNCAHRAAAVTIDQAGIVGGEDVPDYGDRPAPRSGRQRRRGEFSESGHLVYLVAAITSLPL